MNETGPYVALPLTLTGAMLEITPPVQVVSFGP